eukprot:jgi/Botrbrau1/16864/Bobra.150_2s0083.1
MIPAAAKEGSGPSVQWHGWGRWRSTRRASRRGRAGREGHCGLCFHSPHILASPSWELMLAAPAGRVLWNYGFGRSESIQPHIVLCHHAGRAHQSGAVFGLENCSSGRDPLA